MDSKFLLGFVAHQKIGSQTLKKILLAFDNNPEAAWRASVGVINAKLEPKIVNLVLEARTNFDPATEIEKLKKYDISYVTIFDRNYPKILKEAHDCPVILFIRGNAEALNKAAISIVGSRKYTPYGRSCAHSFAKELAKNKLCIISGLALGIDSIAHNGALEAHGLTVGVVGCGLDQIYPASNLLLAKKIIEENGAIISEFPLGTPPLKFNFPARNRIIAGLSRGVLVVEAAEKSGSLITAYCALDYNREVFAIPGNIDSENSAGTNALIKEGAKLVTVVDDILLELNMEKIKNSERAAEIIADSEEEKIILRSLKSSEKSIDELVIDQNLNVVVVSSTLVLMELKGLVEKTPGGKFRVCIKA